VFDTACRWCKGGLPSRGRKRDAVSGSRNVESRNATGNKRDRATSTQRCLNRVIAIDQFRHVPSLVNFIHT